MNPVDSKQKMLSLNELILSSNMAQNTGIGPQEAIVSAILEMSMPTNKHMRYGNSLFIINGGDDRSAYMSAMNVDTPRNFVENVRKFLTASYLLGFDNLMTVFSQPELIRVFEIISKDPPQPDMAYEVKQKPSGQFMAIIQLGPLREVGS